MLFRINDQLCDWYQNQLPSVSYTRQVLNNFPDESSRSGIDPSKSNKFQH